MRDVNHFHHFDDGATCSLPCGLFCLVLNYIKSILYVACLMVLLHCEPPRVEPKVSGVHND